MSVLPTTTTTPLPPMGRAEGPLVRPTAPVAGGGLGFKALLSILLRHLWLAVITFTAVTAVVWSAYTLCKTFIPAYTAKGYMVLTNMSAIGQGYDRSMDPWTTKLRATNLAFSIIAEQTLTDLLSQDTAKATKWWKNHSGEQRFKDEGPLAVLKPKVDASLVKDSDRIMVSVSDRDAEAAAQMCTALMDLFIKRSRERVGRQTTGDKAALEGERKAAEGRLEPVLQTISSMENDKDFSGLMQARTDIYLKVNNLTTMLTTQELHVNERKRAYDAVEAMKSPDVPATPDMIDEAQRDPTYTNLQQRYQALTEDLTTAVTKLGPNHPDVVNLQARIREIEDTLKQKLQSLTQDVKRRQIGALSAALDDAQKLLDDIKAQLSAAQAEKHRIEVTVTNYDSKVKDREQLNAQIDKLNDRIRDIDIQTGRNLPELVASNYATVPDEISFPRWELFLAANMVLGLGAAIGLVLLSELIDSSVRTPRDVSEHIRLPLLGFVPMVQPAPATRRDIARLVVSDPMAAVAESFRQIRTNLLFSAPVDQLHSIAVTSAARDEGKTTVATNLAITIALSGRRVLLIDANFRRPALAEVFGLAGATGLSNVLTNQAQLADAAQATDVPNLKVVTTGPTPPNPAELLGSAMMRGLLDQADAEYDLVIFDSPPALLVSDTLMLATMVDGVVAVVRASTTSRGMVGRMRDQLHRVRSHILGAVLNAARPTRGGYFRQSQQQYESYLNRQA